MQARALHGDVARRPGRPRPPAASSAGSSAATSGPRRGACGRRRRPRARRAGAPAGARPRADDAPALADRARDQLLERSRSRHAPVVDHHDRSQRRLGLVELVRGEQQRDARVAQRGRASRRSARGSADRRRRWARRAARRAARCSTPQAMLSRRRHPAREALHRLVGPRSSRPVQRAPTRRAPRSACRESPWRRPNTSRFSRAGELRVDGDLLRNDAELGARALRPQRRPASAICRRRAARARRSRDERRLAGPVRTQEPSSSPASRRERAPWAPACRRKTCGRRVP